MKQDSLIIFIIILFLGAFGFLLFYTPNTPELAYKPVDVGGGSVTIKDQDQINFVVFDTELVKPGFVTIHRTMTDAPTEIIGVTDYLEAGVYENLRVDLTGEMYAGFKYAAILHVDDGTKQFEAQQDFPVMTNGEVVRPYFLAIPEAERILAPEE